MYLFRAWDSPAKAASRFFSVCVPAYLDIVKSSFSNLGNECEKLQKSSKNCVFRAFGTPDWIRTSGLQSRSLTRYPTAPRAHTERYKIFSLPAIRGNSSQTVVSSRRFFSCRSVNAPVCRALRRISAGTVRNVGV